MQLTADAVSQIFRDCLFKEGEDHSGHIAAHGIMTVVGFHPQRIKNHKEEIVKLLYALPIEFQEASGGGFSFLAACNDKNGEQWTGMQVVMEQLFLLGMAAKRVKCLMPREMWSMLPGGMPYYAVTEVEI